MSPQEYIVSQLGRLKESNSPAIPKNDLEMVEHIYTALMSKKFRKYSVPETNKTVIREDIVLRVKNKEPLLIQYPFGGYKLWRLEEAPEADWAELFSLMYYVRWLKPICKVYEPGIRFVFRLDEVVVKKLNNISEEETGAYRKSFERVISFLESFIPHNFKYEIFLERSRYESYEVFEKELEVEIEALRAERAKNPQPLSQVEIAAIEMNVRPLPGQTDNPQWREEIDLIHIAYYNLQEHKQHPIKHYMDEGIIGFPFMFEAPNIVAVGTTKTSVAKFWVGVGALKRKGDSYIETVLSPQQLADSEFTRDEVQIDGLEGKNFNRIRVIG